MIWRGFVRRDCVAYFDFYQVVVVKSCWDNLRPPCCVTPYCGRGRDGMLMQVLPTELTTCLFGLPLSIRSYRCNFLCSLIILAAMNSEKHGMGSVCSRGFLDALLCLLAPALSLLLVKCMIMSLGIANMIYHIGSLAGILQTTSATTC